MPLPSPVDGQVNNGSTALLSEVSGAGSTPTTVRTVRTVRLSGSAIVFAGLICVVVGTFAPWLTSGGVDRNSYAIAGIVDRLGLAGNGYESTALTWWPFIGPIAMVALIAGILRWWRTSAWIATVFGALTGVIGGGVMAVAGGHPTAGIEVARTGPVITVLGAAATILGAVVVLVAVRWSKRQSPQQVPDRSQ